MKRVPFSALAALLCSICIISFAATGCRGGEQAEAEQTPASGVKPSPEQSVEPFPETNLEPARVENWKTFDSKKIHHNIAGMYVTVDYPPEYELLEHENDNTRLEFSRYIPSENIIQSLEIKVKCYSSKKNKSKNQKGNNVEPASNFEQVVDNLKSQPSIFKKFKFAGRRAAEYYLVDTEQMAQKAPKVDMSAYRVIEKSESTFIVLQCYNHVRYDEVRAWAPININTPFIRDVCVNFFNSFDFIERSQLNFNRRIHYDMYTSPGPIYRNYHDDEIQADCRYKNKMIRIHGEVVKSGKVSSGDIYIILSSIDLGQKPHERIKLVFDKKYALELSDIGHPVPFEANCIGAGMFDGEPVLKDCIP
ncbi:MAG: OB-fold putative lipoprotein [Deltaproteobacteria bacterium]|jgi:hypothetical protein|nr:OB-fold putative lipoprotein [Deltaproteobacteria bacterium]